MDLDVTKKLVESAPTTIDVAPEKLEALRSELEEAGATIGDLYLGDDGGDTPGNATAPAVSSLPDNPIRAFMTGTVWLRGCASHPESADRGQSLVAIMAAQMKDENDLPTLPLSVADCAAVLSFLCHRDGERGECSWGFLGLPHVPGECRPGHGCGHFSIDSVHVTSVPEPETILLLLPGLLAVLIWRRRT